MFKKMMVLCLAAVCMMSSLDVITAKAEQVCGAEEYLKIINGISKLYGESGIMEYSEDFTISEPGNEKFRVSVNCRYNFKKGVCTGVAMYSTGKKVSAKFKFTYDANTDKIKYKELINKDVMALLYTKDIVLSNIKVDNAIDVVDSFVSILCADESNVVEKTKNGFKGTVVSCLGTKSKFNISIDSEFKKIESNSVNTKGDGAKKLKIMIKKIG